MGTYILRRLLLIIPTLLLILLVNFAVVQVAPGGPVEIAIERARTAGLSTGSETTTVSATTPRYQGSRGLSPEMVAQIEKQYGFDQPAPVRFWRMLKSYAQLDFGRSFFKDKPVTTLLWERLPVTLTLGLWSTLLIYLIAVPLGIAKARRAGSTFDAATTLILTVAYAVPTFLFALILLLLFAGGSYWQWFPLQGLVSENFHELGPWDKVKDYLWHITLPVIASTIGGFAGLAFLTKFTFMEELGKQYVLTARAKGLTERQVLWKHVFRNAMLLVIAGLPEALVGIFLAGNFFIEIIFNLDGLGLLGYEAIKMRDYPVIFGTLFLFTLVGLLLKLISDVLYQVIDPRIDFASREQT